LSGRFVPRAPTLANRIDQRLFDAIYSRSLIYNSWENPAVDGQALDLRCGDTPPAITSAAGNVLDYARRVRLETVHSSERRAPLPYLPGCSVPYYILLGRKRSARPRSGA